MKRTLIVIIAALLFLLKTDIAAQDATASATPTPIQYTLPYPGLLPDHPLWFVKAIRDKIISFLISDPLKKSEFDLKQADKRLSAGVALIKKGKTEEGISTISKAENYLEEAVRSASLAKTSGKDVMSWLETLMNASKKHREVILEVEQTVSPDVRDSLLKERQRLEKLEKDVEEIRIK